MVKNKNGFSAKKRKELIFYISIMALPILQLLIFYFYANVRSFTLAFTEYDASGVYKYAGIKNFAAIFNGEHSIFKNFNFGVILENSLLVFIVDMFLAAVPAIMFSYYIFKKHPCSSLFKIVLYLPHIVPGLVFVIIYKYFMNDLLPSIGLIKVGYWEMSVATERFYYMGFGVFLSFGTKVLLYSGTMSGISDSIIESGRLDGITPMKELFLIVVPMIWGTIVTFAVTYIIGIFTSDMMGYAFKAGNFNSKLWTFGYFLFKETAVGDMYTYPILAALGLMMTAIAAPLAILTRHLLTRYGPSVE